MFSSTRKCAHIETPNAAAIDPALTSWPIKLVLAFGPTGDRSKASAATAAAALIAFGSVSRKSMDWRSLVSELLLLVRAATYQSIPPKEPPHKIPSPNDPQTHIYAICPHQSQRT